jgi:WD40 repeat protein
MDGSICVWNAKTGEIVQSISGHTGKVYALESLGDGLLGSGSADSTLRVWNTCGSQFPRGNLVAPRQ